MSSKDSGNQLPSGQRDRRSKSSAQPVQPPAAEEHPDPLLGVWLGLSRFGSDALGMLFLALALITLLGISGLTQGTVVGPWVSLLTVGLGWGSPLVVIVLAVLGVICFRRHFVNWPKFSLGRIVALEGVAFCALILLAIFGGLSLERAEAGQDGGVIGWGLATLLDQLLPAPWSTVATLILALFLVGYGAGLLQWALQRLENWLNRLSLAKPVEPVARQADVSTPAQDESKEENWVQPTVFKRDPRLPPLTLLMDEQPAIPDEKVILETGAQIEKTLAEFGLPVRVMGYRIGPTITQFAVEPGFIDKIGPDGEPFQQKVRVAQISALQRDLALSLKAERLRIEAPVPGRSYVGIEVPNPKNTVVRLKSLMEGEAFQKLSSPLAVALGKDVSGLPLVVDLARMPHLLIAGTTGSGKSVCIAAIVTCLVANNHPERMRMALMDPKMVELARFNGLPHLFGKVEVEVDRMLGVLKWALMEMDNRYRLLETAHTRDIDTYNRRAEKRNQALLPRIVVIVDELADLMISAPEQTEHSLVRLAQMARAVGIHLVVATQRPSTDVVTGLIKANFPARLAFSVASSIDSRVILDTNGAESLLGKGDMLFLNPEVGTPTRAQGVLISDHEIDVIQNFWKSQSQPAQVQEAPWEELIADAEENGDDELVKQAVELVRRTQRGSASLLQRRLRIGYPRAARLIDQLEEMGVVGPSQGSGKDREVLLDPDADADAGEEGDGDLA
jgi:S-DNA-T family DNA segregation ATPase FtsK/SpoIIIE